MLSDYNCGVVGGVWGVAGAGCGVLPESVAGVAGVAGAVVGTALPPSAGFTVGATGVAVSTGFCCSCRRSLAAPFWRFGFGFFLTVSPFRPSGAAWVFSVDVCSAVAATGRAAACCWALAARSVALAKAILA